MHRNLKIPVILVGSGLLVGVGVIGWMRLHPADSVLVFDVELVSVK